MCGLLVHRGKLSVSVKTKTMKEITLFLNLKFLSKYYWTNVQESMLSKQPITMQFYPCAPEYKDLLLYNRLDGETFDIQLHFIWYLLHDRLSYIICHNVW